MTYIKKKKSWFHCRHQNNELPQNGCGVRALSGLLAGMKRRWMSGHGYVLTRAKSESEKDDREEKLFKVAILK
ncbi:hypothetical protein NC653_008574 [Populus alba x Populus x berolinensis]|uniref:Uncharacterized protein n=1 Tax=Populus alba x Populus x berolinensis TaxID=444605 RepID=A0AAD6R728_9ROSI|nr:hypothetical protein NC653_008574 [Populus alba x Populus x berolinensis]